MENNFNDIIENDNSKELELKKIKDAGKSFNKLFINFIAYLFLLNIAQSVAYGIFELLNYKNTGFLMILSTTITCLIYMLINKNKLPLESILKEKKQTSSIYSFFCLVGLIFFSGFIFSLIGLGLSSLLPFETPNVTQEIIESGSFSIYLYACLAGPFTEEVIFRGYFRKKLQGYGPMVSIFASGLLFSIIHLNLAQSIGVLGMGMILGYASHFYSFKTAVLLHMFLNTFITILGIIQDKSPLLAGVFSILYIGLMVIGVFYFYKNRKQVRENLFGKESDRFYFKAYFKNYGLYIFLLIFIPFIVFLPILIV